MQFTQQHPQPQPQQQLYQQSQQHPGHLQQQHYPPHQQLARPGAPPAPASTMSSYPRPAVPRPGHGQTSPDQLKVPGHGPRPGPWAGQSQAPVCDGEAESRWRGPGPGGPGGQAGGPGRAPATLAFLATCCTLLFTREFLARARGSKSSSSSLVSRGSDRCSFARVSSINYSSSNSSLSSSRLLTLSSSNSRSKLVTLNSSCSSSNNPAPTRSSRAPTHSSSSVVTCCDPRPS